ncbi:MAG: hypothetical protein WKF93_11290 [Acidimicrobiales bacterium]
MRGLVVLAAMSAVLSGCGGDEPETSATTVAGAVTEATAATPDAGDATATTRAGNGGNAGPAAVQPCRLITPVEASEIIGTDVGEGQTLPFETGTACIYQRGGSVVGVQVYSAPGTEELLAANALLFAPDAVPIDGIGEAAFISDAEATIGVLQDGVVFTITLVADGG